MFSYCFNTFVLPIFQSVTVQRQNTLIMCPPFVMVVQLLYLGVHRLLKKRFNYSKKFFWERAPNPLVPSGVFHTPDLPEGALP